MMDEEEDIIFDDAALLPSDGRESGISAPKSVRSRGRIAITVCLCAAFFGLGLFIAMPGPTLLDLQEQTHTDTEQISRIFTGRSVGYLVGSIIGGLLFDKLNQPCLLSISLLLSSLGTAAVPWCKNYLLLMAVIAFQGVSMGFLDTGGNVLCLQIWGRYSGPYMQAMHCAFGVGAFVAPLIAEPFLSHNIPNTTDFNISDLPTTTVLYQAPNIVKRGLFEGQEALQNRDKRDLEPSGNPLVLSNNTAATTPKPTKPMIADASHLDPNPRIADGSQIGKEIVKIEQQQVKSTPAPTLPPPDDDLEGNYTLTNSSHDDFSEQPIATSTIAPTIPTTTIPTTTTSTTTTTTTTSPVVDKQENPKLSVSDSTNNNSTSNDTISDDNESTFQTIKNQVSNIFNVVNDLSRVQFAYLSISSFVLLVSFAFMVICCGGRHKTYTLEAVEDDETLGIGREDFSFRIQILVLLFFFYFLYVGMEVTYGGLAMTFSVTCLGWTKTRGTMLTSVFWGSFAGGRGLAIFLAKCLSPPIMLILDLIVVILSLIGLVMVTESSSVVMWVCSALLGVGMASIFPTGITWAERYMCVTGKAAAVFVVGSALGEMIMPALTGFLFESKGPMWLMYIMLGASMLSVVMYIVMQNLATNMGERYKRLQYIPDAMKYSSESEYDDVEMDSLTPDEQEEWSQQRKKKVTFNLRGSHRHRNGVGQSRHNTSNGNTTTGSLPSILKTSTTTASTGSL